MNTQLNGSIGSMVYNGYEYRDIRVSADIAKRLFNGAIEVHEPNIDLDFKGTINFQEKLPVFNFVADIRSLQLDRLQLLAFTRDANLSCHADIELRGNKVDNLTGSLTLTDIN
jgi:hypothetical protein